MIIPYDWQLPAVDDKIRILTRGDFCLDASDTGTGKTVTALATARALDTRFLVVCPKAVHTAWERTAEAMGCAHLMVGVVNAERLRFKNPYFYGNTWQVPRDTLIIWDEVHRGASGDKSQTTKIVALLRPLGYKVMAMSATVASTPLQLRAVGYLAGLHRFKPSSYYRWCLDMGCFRMQNIPGLHFPKGAVGRRRMLELHQALSPVLVRIRKDEVPDFPETNILVNLYDLDKKYTKEIEEAWENMREELKEAATSELTARLRAREIAELCKVALLEDLVRESLEEGNSVVVFVHFRSTLAELKARLPEAVTIYGGQSTQERQAAVDSFQADDASCLLCMAQAGGVGISLHQLPGRRPRVTYLTPGDKADDYKQCLGRVNRAGGGFTTQTVVLAAGTVEEKVQQNLAMKLRNLDALQDGDVEIN